MLNKLNTQILARHRDDRETLLVGSKLCDENHNHFKLRFFLKANHHPQI